MKKVNFKIFSLLVALGSLTLASTNSAYGQSYEVGGGLGTSVYSGDIIRKIDPGQAGLQGTLFGKRNFDNVWSLKLGVSVAELMAADSIQPIDAMASLRNAHVSGRITEFSALMEFNFLDYVNHKSEFKFSPYAFFGLGYSFVQGEGRINSSLPVEEYRLSTMVIPFGGGVKYLLSNQLTLGMELGFRPTTSDFLDKLDSTLPALARYDTPIDPKAAALAKGLNYGNPYTKDWYYFLGLTLSYTITKARCYTY
ncbi:MAG: hypothetical protein FJX97_00625 [Bacteroidetes bacterium]|nr:hypothetical protein [Bacteroidota bacterium]